MGLSVRRSAQKIFRFDVIISYKRHVFDREVRLIARKQRSGRMIVDDKHAVAHDGGILYGIEQPAIPCAPIDVVMERDVKNAVFQRSFQRLNDGAVGESAPFARIDGEFPSGYTRF